jgi:hypothetical protein
VFFALSANSQLSKTEIKSDCRLGGMCYKILVKSVVVVVEFITDEYLETHMSITTITNKYNQYKLEMIYKR